MSEDNLQEHESVAEDNTDSGMLVYIRGVPHVDGKPVDRLGMRDLFRHRKVYDDEIYQAAPILSLVILGAFVVCLIFAILGVVLVAIGATGDTQLKIFGQELSATNVGVSVIFISAVSLVFLIRRVMQSLDLAIRSKGQRM